MKFRTHRPLDEMKKQEREIYTEDIEVWSNPNQDIPNINARSMHLYDEVSCLTKSGNPGIATTIVVYQPDKYVLELRSLKYLLSRFRNDVVSATDISNYMNEIYRQYTKPKFVIISTKLTDLVTNDVEYGSVWAIRTNNEEYDIYSNDTKDFYNRVYKLFHSIDIEEV